MIQQRVSLEGIHEYGYISSNDMIIMCLGPAVIFGNAVVVTQGLVRMDLVRCLCRCSVEIAYSFFPTHTQQLPPIDYSSCFVTLPGVSKQPSSRRHWTKCSCHLLFLQASTKPISPTSALNSSVNIAKKKAPSSKHGTMKDPLLARNRMYIHIALTRSHHIHSFCFKGACGFGVCKALSSLLCLRISMVSSIKVIVMLS